MRASYSRESLLEDLRLHFLLRGRGGRPRPRGAQREPAACGDICRRRLRRGRSSAPARRHRNDPDNAPPGSVAGDNPSDCPPVDVAPPQGRSRLQRDDHGMVGLLIVRPGVPPWRVIGACDPTAGQAHPQRSPARCLGEALAAAGRSAFNWLDGLNMLTPRRLAVRRAAEGAQGHLAAPLLLKQPGAACARPITDSKSRRRQNRKGQTEQAS